MSYIIFYWVHIVSYIAWLLAFAGSLYFAYRAGKSFKTPDEKRFVLLERKATSIGAHVGALGILISGGAMASIPSGPGWSWFNFEQYAWLGVKQVLFLLILVLVGFSIKRSVNFKKLLKSEDNDLLSDETRRGWKRAYDLSMIVYALVVFNTVLGLYKPF